MMKQLNALRDIFAANSAGFEVICFREESVAQLLYPPYSQGHGRTFEEAMLDLAQTVLCESQSSYLTEKLISLLTEEPDNESK